ncbi:MAG: deoxyguanosinetriphosphate triphosphohydrolase [Ruminococcaceae bacterium]|nr:deoxyguanosinetriphosphate triphosphohydrolase [Oscillospiraceae bacterium]
MENYGCTRDLFLENEKRTLSVYACLTSESKGREKPLLPCPVRTEFQRDRDRILHSQSFRRLMNKTQVFLAPAGDHYRTRMTHTLEVTQIARIIARALRLNEDLTEAAALGHDIGHTPFGHAGEFAMQKCYDPSFTHYKQSLRVVEKLENDGEGLNLTFEVRDGIVNHTGKHMASTLEGVIVKYADRIAYINHDIDDACRAGILSPNDIPAGIRGILGNGHSERINSMVNSIIRESASKPYIRMESEFQTATDGLRDFLFEKVYRNPIAKSEESKAQEMLMRLFDYYVKHPERMPELYKRECEYEPVERCVCDFLSGMTDRYAIEIYSSIHIPKVWRGPQV